MAGPAYEWGTWRFEPTECRLMRDGELVPLPAKTLDVLFALLRRAPRLVTKEEIFAAVWPDAAVEEGNIAFHVAALRKALDQGDGPSAIETVRGRGYRFVADVVIGEMAPTDEIQRRSLEGQALQAITELAPAVELEPIVAPVDIIAAPPYAPSRRSLRGPAVLATLVAIVAAVAWLIARPQTQTIAVQAFDVVNPSSGMDLPDGLYSYLTTTLRRLDIPLEPYESATAILNGELQPGATGYRVTARLTDKNTGDRLWEWSFDVAFDEGQDAAAAGQDEARLRLQGIMAQRIADGLKSYLSLSGAAPVTR